MEVGLVGAWTGSRWLQSQLFGVNDADAPTYVASEAVVRIRSLQLRSVDRTADEAVPFAHLVLYAKKLPRATVRALRGRGHQLGDELTEVAADIKDLPPAR